MRQAIRAAAASTEKQNGSDNRAPPGQREGASLFVNFAGDEMTLLIEAAMDLGMNEANLSTRARAARR